MANKSKVLFLSSMAHQSKTGGAVVAKRNLYCLKSICGEDNIIFYPLYAFGSSYRFFDKIARLNHIIRCYMNGDSPKKENDIMNIIEGNQIRTVFVDSSLNGKLIKRIKQLSCPPRVICFFHNCEYELIKQGIAHGELLGLIRLLPAYFNERWSSKYSDDSVVLNKRDEILLKKKYETEVTACIPVSVDDQCTVFQGKPIDKTKKILFVGSNFFPNIYGANWFIKNVLPFCNASFTVAGKNLAQANILSHDRVRVVSDPEDLSSLYYDADVVVVPLFQGGGMKVKVAEALMYGKNVLATLEAMHGYEDVPSIKGCNSAQDFITAIDSLQGDSFSIVSRDYFLKHYSYMSAIELYSKILLK